jgi:hypothetical protein
VTVGGEVTVGVGVADGVEVEVAVGTCVGGTVGTSVAVSVGVDGSRVGVSPDCAAATPAGFRVNPIHITSSPRRIRYFVVFIKKAHFRK